MEKPEEEDFTQMLSWYVWIPNQLESGIYSIRDNCLACRLLHFLITTGANQYCCSTVSANAWPKTKGIDGSVQSSHHAIETGDVCLFIASATNHTHGASIVRVQPWTAPLSIAAESQSVSKISPIGVLPLGWMGMVCKPIFY